MEGYALRARGAPAHTRHPPTDKTDETPVSATCRACGSVFEVLDPEGLLPPCRCGGTVAPRPPTPPKVSEAVVPARGPQVSP